MKADIFLSEYAKEKNFKTIILKTQKQRRITVAAVTLFHGERSFIFFGNYESDYILSLYNMKKLNIKKNDIVHLGSLMLSEKEGSYLDKYGFNKLR